MNLPPRLMSAARFASLAFALLALTPSLARAQGPASPAPPPAASPTSSGDRAADLKKQGDAAMESLRYADALGAYAQAYALTKDPALLYNQGRAQQALGNFPDALADFDRFSKEAGPELRARVPQLDELMADVRKHVAELAIKCDVRGARVLVRDKIAGTTPLSAPLQMDAGYAVVEVDAEGYETYRRNVDLQGGSQTVLDVTLVLKKLTAILHVESTAASAEVFVDGTPMGNAPIETTVQPGQHKVAVHRAGFEDTVSTIEVLAGERKDVTLEPQRNAPITAKWWFWTGIGVVVVGGAVTTAALLISKPHGTGDSFSPSTISAPLRF